MKSRLTLIVGLLTLVLLSNPELRSEESEDEGCGSTAAVTSRVDPGSAFNGLWKILAEGSTSTTLNTMPPALIATGDISRGTIAVRKCVVGTVRVPRRTAAAAPFAGLDDAVPPYFDPSVHATIPSDLKVADKSQPKYTDEIE